MPGLGHALGKNWSFFDTKVQYSVFHFVLIASCPSTGFHWKKSNLLYSQMFAYIDKTPPEPPLFHIEQPQLSVFVREEFKPLDYLFVPSLDLLHQLHVFLVLRIPELDILLQVGSHKSRVEGDNQHPCPAHHVV